MPFKDTKLPIEDADFNIKMQAATINEIQLMLAEKRTSLAFMRTGIAVFALPLSVLSALIATSKFYHFSQVLYLLVPVLIVCFGLIILGAYLTTRAVFRVRYFSYLILELKKRHSYLKDLLE